MAHCIKTGIVKSEANESIRFHYLLDLETHFLDTEESEQQRIILTENYPDWFIEVKKSHEERVFYRIAKIDNTAGMCLTSLHMPDEPVLWFHTIPDTLDYQFFMILNQTFKQLGFECISFFKGN